jgi:cytochrome c oxidase assembly factor 6
MTSFPNKEERAKCWSSRDAYWACLDEAESKGTKLEACKDLQKLYESSCPSQWVGQNKY